MEYGYFRTRVVYRGAVENGVFLLKWCILVDFFVDLQENSRKPTHGEVEISIEKKQQSYCVAYAGVKCPITETQFGKMQRHPSLGTH